MHPANIILTALSLLATVAVACATGSRDASEQTARETDVLSANGAGSAEGAQEQEPRPGKRVLRVCADPNNLPFSNQRLEGFENRIAALLARELDAELAYTWWAQRRGFFRNTLKAGLCDLVIGVPRQLDMVATTRPFYRSSYVFVTRAGAPRLRTLDDPALRRLRIGVHLIGDDYANSPPVHALSSRGVVDNLVGYRLLGDYSEESPPARVVEAVASGDVDVAIVWGPFGGYFARRSEPPLEVSRVEESRDDSVLPLSYEMGLGLRHGEPAFLAELEDALAAKASEIRTVLTEFHVPLLAIEEDR
jgi:mxaJ protein